MRLMMYRTMDINERKMCEDLIISKLKLWEISYRNIENDIVLKYVYDLYENGVYADCDDALYLLYAATFANYNDKNYNLSEKYYLLAIDKNKRDSAPIYNLALLYDKHEKYTLSEYYYSMAIKKGCTPAILNLARLYDLRGEYDLAEMYYLTAIERGCIKSIHNLALMYNKSGEYELAEKYYLMAIEKKLTPSMYSFASYNERKKEFELSRRYYIMGALNYHDASIQKINKLMICKFDLDDMIQLINVLNDHNYNILNDVLKFVISEIENAIHK